MDFDKTEVPMTVYTFPRFLISKQKLNDLQFFSERRFQLFFCMVQFVLTAWSKTTNWSCVVQSRYPEESDAYYNKTEKPFSLQGCAKYDKIFPDIQKKIFAYDL